MTASQRFIRAAMATFGLSTLAALDSAADVPRGTVGRWFRGNAPRGPHLRRVSVVLGVDAEKLAALLAADREAAR